MSEPRKQLGDYVTITTSLTDLRKSASTSSLKARCLETGEATVPDVDRFEGSDDVTNKSAAGTCDVTKVEVTKSGLPSIDGDYDDDDVFDNDDAKVPDFFKFDECTTTPSESTSDSDSSSSNESDDHTVKESEESSSDNEKSTESDESESDSDLRIKVLEKIKNIRISKPKKVHFTVIVEERIEYEVTNYQHEGRCTMWVPKLNEKNKEE